MSEHLWMTVEDVLRIVDANTTRQEIERALIANLPSNGGPPPATQPLEEAMNCAYCKEISVCAICGKGYAEAVRADAAASEAPDEAVLSLCYQLTNALVSEYGLKNGNPIYRALRQVAEVALCNKWLAASPATKPSDWRKDAALWLRAKARGQEQSNAENPRHAEAYPSWTARVTWLKWLAEELEGHPTYGSFGPAPIYEDAAILPEPTKGGA